MKLLVYNGVPPTPDRLFFVGPTPTMAGILTEYHRKRLTLSNSEILSVHMT